MFLNHQPQVAWGILLALASLVLPAAAVADTRVVEIADGDYPALQDKLCEAAQRGDGRTVIHLAERGYYPVSRRNGALPPRWRACQYGGRTGTIPIAPGARIIMTDVVIEGHNATLDFEGALGFGVSDDGRLQLEAVELRNSSQALSVEGRAELSRVSVLYNYPEYPDQRAPLHNRGYLALRNTLIAANRILQVPEELLVAEGTLEGCADTASAGILNGGTLVLNNVTLYDNDWQFIELPAKPTGVCVTRDLVNLPGADARIGNSLLNSGLVATCAGTVRSSGYNSVPEGDACGFDGPGDIVRVTENGYPYVRHEDVRQVGRQMFQPDSDRLALGSPEPAGASASACEAVDIRGYVRGAAHDSCHRGAWEPGAAPALDPGLDGLWFDPENDGQYLQLSHYGRDRILMTWYGFDHRGEQLWVYALAVYEGGNRVRANAWRNTGVRLVNGMLEGEIRPEPWGELSVEAESCNSLRLEMRANDPAFAPISYPLTRLTYNTVAPCGDRAEQTTAR